MSNLEVVPITKKLAQEFVTKKHYSRRMSIYWQGFGLREEGKLVGVAVYGQPSPPIQKHAFVERDFRLFELARVVIQTETKNAGSFLVGNSLKLLEPSPCAVISYADMEQGHAGYMYQATNWTYTGATISHDKMYLVDGVRTHPMTLRDRGITAPVEWAKANGIEMVKPFPKHRYFQFVGNKTEKKLMRSKLKYPVVGTYPKAEPSRYDDGEFLDINI